MDTLFDTLELAPRDPILGLSEQYNHDARPAKVNLSIGVYYNDVGKIPLLAAVRQAEETLFKTTSARGYLPIEGLTRYNQNTQILLLGEDSPLIASGRALTTQTLGGTGALKVGADFLHRLLPQTKVYISDPSWENHRALFEYAGFQVATYPYYDKDTQGLNFDGWLACLKSLAPHSIVVLHACCHNPTGIDPSPAQWQQIADVMKAQRLVPFLDIAYQGFGAGLAEDAAVVRLFANQNMPVFISSSFSKSFSLYGERVGALTVITHSKDETARVLSHIKRIIRTNYSNPPTHGGAIVATILNTPELFKEWEEELKAMRSRIHLMRHQLVEKIHAQGSKRDFSAVLKQRGMFSYSGLTALQVARLCQEHAVYALSSGRICIAALNSNNIDTVAQNIAAILQ
jgi:aromatic-amino-acid transaminase